MRIITATALAFFIASPAVTSGLAAETLQSCAAKPEAERLPCYDQLAEDTVSTVTVEAAEPSAWIVQSEVSPVDDSKNVFLQVSGVDGIENQYGQDKQIDLTISCRENVTAAYITFGGLFMSDLNGSGRVTYRVDANAAASKSFSESNDHEALGLWNGGTSIPWIKSLFGGKRMYVEATPYSENKVSDFMPIAGLEDAIKPLRAACGW